jgi:hypothetical protein
MPWLSCFIGDGACINPVSALCALVNGALTVAMIALLPLLLAAAPAPVAERMPVSKVATASVTIIRAETIEVEPKPSTPPKPDRQYRQRDSVPMVEFY